MVSCHSLQTDELIRGITSQGEHFTVKVEQTGTVTIYSAHRTIAIELDRTSKVSAAVPSPMKDETATSPRGISTW